MDKERQARQQQKLAERHLADSRRQASRVQAGLGNVAVARAQLRGSLEVADHPRSRRLWLALQDRPAVWWKSYPSPPHVDISPDGRLLAVATDGEPISVLSLESLAPLKLRDVIKGAGEIRFSPDSKRLAVERADGGVRLLDLGGGVVDMPACGPKRSISQLVFGKQGRYLYGATTRKTCRWDLRLAGRRPDVVAVWPAAMATTGKGLRMAVALPKRTLQDGFHTPRVRPVPLRFSFLNTFSDDGSLLAGINRSSARIVVADLTRDTKFTLLLGMKACALALNRARTRLGVASCRGKIQVWDLRRRQLLLQIARPGGRITRLAFTPDGRRLVSAHKNGYLRLWDLEPSRHHFMIGHRGPVRRVVFSPNGELLVSSGADGRAISWDLATGHPRWHLPTEGGDAVAATFSRNGAHLVTAGKDGVVRLWDHKYHQQHKRLRGHSRPVWDMAFSPNGKILATADAFTTRLWEGVGGKLLRTIKHPGLAFRWQPLGHNPGCLAFHPDGTLLAKSSQSEVHVHEVATGKRLTTVLSGLGSQVAFGPRGTLAVGMLKGSVVLIDATSGKRLGLLGAVGHEAQFQIKAGARGPASVRPVFLPGGEQVLMVTPHHSGGWFTVMLVDRQNRRRQRMPHRSAVRAAAVAPGGRYLATGTRDGTVHLWDLQRRRPVWHDPLPAAVVDDKKPSPWLEAARGARLVAVGPGSEGCLITFGGKLQMWDTNSKTPLLEARLKVRPAQLLAATGGACVVRGLRGGVTLFRKGRQPLALAASACRPNKPSPSCVTAVALHGDSVLLARGPHLDEVDGGGARRRRVTIPAGAHAVGQVGEHLVVAVAVGKVVRLPASGGKGGQPFEDLPTSSLESLAAGPPGTGTVALGFTSGDVGIWDIKSGERLIRARLRGAATSLAIQGTILHAASELGDRRALDFSAMTLDRCAFLKRVREMTPFLHKGNDLTPAGCEGRRACPCR